ncbi:MAG: hypothetical protein RLZZ524_305, partial [Pseudomonadota bacterium]
MARNIEIKARLASPGVPNTPGTLETIEPRVAAIATQGPELLLQDDTFFGCAQGRLKLRA